MFVGNGLLSCLPSFVLAVVFDTRTAVVDVGAPAVANLSRAT